MNGVPQKFPVHREPQDVTLLGSRVFAGVVSYDGVTLEMGRP